MLDQATERFLRDTVEDFMLNGTSFTSLDIANIAKDASYRARNHEVANWLRRNAISISYDGTYLYDQSLIQVDSKEVGMTLAYCYHHYMRSTDEYLDRDQNPKSFLRMVTPPQSFNSALDNIPVLPAAVASLAQVTTTFDIMYFGSREKAREYCRSHPEAKFVDQGYSSLDGERWSCVAR